jgi:hypothetical protein
MASREQSRRSLTAKATRSRRQPKGVAISVSTGQSVILGPRPKRRTDEQLDRIARALAQSFPDLRNPLTWTSIKAVCKRLEIDLRCVALGSSARLMHFSGSWAIRINKKYSRTERLRFAAHELAHFILHRNHLVRARLREIRACELKAWSDVEEDEANRFAEILLTGVGEFSSRSGVSA